DDAEVQNDYLNVAEAIGLYVGLEPGERVETDDVVTLAMEKQCDRTGYIGVVLDHDHLRCAEWCGKRRGILVYHGEYPPRERMPRIVKTKSRPRFPSSSLLSWP